MLNNIKRLSCISKSLLVAIAITLCTSIASHLHAQAPSTSDCSSNSPEILITLSSGEVRSVAADEDYDKDGVSNKLEQCGYKKDDAKIGEFASCQDTDKQCFRTDPTRWSTDQDPYSDGEEVLGNLPPSTLPPGSSPLVPAYPAIGVQLDNFEIIPIETITDATGTTLSGSITVGVSGSVTASEETSATCRDVEVVIAECEGSAKETGSITIGGHVDVTTGGAFSWNTSTTMDPSRAAKLKLQVHATNSGLATAQDIKPVINLLVKGQSIATLQPDWNIDELDSGNGRYPSRGSVTIEKDAHGNDIVISLDKLTALMSGQEFTLEVPAVSASILRWDPDSNPPGWGWKGNWKEYETEIIHVSSSVSLTIGEGDESKKIERLVYTADENVTVKDILPRIFDVKVDGSQIFIEGHALNKKDWKFLWSPKDSSRSEQGKDILQYSLRPGDRLTMLLPKPGEKPTVTEAWYSPDLRRVYAAVRPATLPISDVNATVMIGGTLKKVKLEQDADKSVSSGFWSNREPFDSPATPLDHQGEQVVTAKALLGNLSDPKGIEVAAPFETCEQVRGNVKGFPDGDYVLFAGGDSEKPFLIYCADMELDKTPKEYLTLKALDPADCVANLNCSHNYSLIPASDPSGTTCCDSKGYYFGTPVMTRFEKIRLDPRTMEVGVSDFRYADSVGKIDSYKAATKIKVSTITKASYARGWNCTRVGKNAPGRANIDLSDTPFAIDSTFKRVGWASYVKEKDVSSDRKTATISGGGQCGGIGGNLILRYTK